MILGLITGSSQWSVIAVQGHVVLQGNKWWQKCAFHFDSSILSHLIIVGSAVIAVVPFLYLKPTCTLCFDVKLYVPFLCCTVLWRVLFL